MYTYAFQIVGKQLYGCAKLERNIFSLGCRSCNIDVKSYREKRTCLAKTTKVIGPISVFAMMTFQRDNMASKRVLLISLSEQQVVAAMLDNGHIRKDMHTQAFIYTREKYCYKGFKTKTEKLLRTNGSICDELTKRCGCESVI